MRTPCQDDPEKWVGDNPRHRAEAERICRTDCPVFTQCKAGMFGTPGLADLGVWAGTDYTNQEKAQPGRACAVCGKVNRSTIGHHPRTCDGCAETKPCDTCGDEFPRTYHSEPAWAAAKFCGRACSAKAPRKVAA